MRLSLVDRCPSAIVNAQTEGVRTWADGQASGGRNMAGRTIAIGDIHGHSAALAALVNRLELTPADTLVLLGDYVDRGPDSKGVIELILGLRPHCQLVPLMGNHEEMMLQARTDRRARWMWLDNGGDQALLSYGDEGNPRSIPESHYEFLAGLSRVFETETHFFVHANYSPNFKLSEQPAMTALWLPLDEPPGPHYSGKTAVVGHTPQPDGRVLDLGHLVCVDTGCGFGGLLTAYEPASGRVWQVDERGQAVG